MGRSAVVEGANETEIELDWEGGQTCVAEGEWEKGEEERESWRRAESKVERWISRGESDWFDPKRSGLRRRLGRQ